MFGARRYSVSSQKGRKLGRLARAKSHFLKEGHGSLYQIKKSIMNIANIYDTIHCIIVYIYMDIVCNVQFETMVVTATAGCLPYLLLTADSDVSPCCFWLNLDSSDIGSCRPMRAWDEEFFAKLVFEFNVVTA